MQNGDLVSGSYQEIKIWDKSTQELKRILKGHTDWVNSLLVLQNGDLASGSTDKIIRIWNVSTGVNTRNLTKDIENEGSNLILRANGDLVSASHLEINVWDTN